MTLQCVGNVAVLLGVDNDRLVPRSSRSRSHDADPAPLLARQVELRPSADDEQSAGRLHRVRDSHLPSDIVLSGVARVAKATPNLL